MLRTVLGKPGQRHLKLQDYSRPCETSSPPCFTTETRTRTHGHMHHTKELREKKGKKRERRDRTRFKMLAVDLVLYGAVAGENQWPIVSKTTIARGLSLTTRSPVTIHSTFYDMERKNCLPTRACVVFYFIDSWAVKSNALCFSHAFYLTPEQSLVLLKNGFIGNWFFVNLYTNLNAII